MESEQLIRGKASLHTIASASPSLDDSLREIELYRYLNQALNIEGLISRARLCLQKVGITDFSHLNCNSVVDALDPFGTYDARVTEQYAKEGFHQDDLATRHLLANNTPIFRSTVCQYIEAAPFENPMFRRHKEATQFMEKHGLLDVYNLIIQGDNSRVLFSISSHMCEPDKFRSIVNCNLTYIHMLANTIDKIGNKKFRKNFHNPKNRPYISLTPKPLQLLEVLANKDITLNDAAAVLNMSISTANQHIAAAKRSLNANTTHGLILAAQREGLILLEGQ